MTEFIPMSHWAWSQMKGEEPRCVGALREIPDGSDQNCIAVSCDTCVFEVGIARPRARPLGVRGDQYVPPADGRIEPAENEFVGDGNARF